MSIVPVGAFRLSKWYMDCASESGDIVIAYAARLHWRAITLHYASVLVNAKAHALGGFQMGLASNSNRSFQYARAELFRLARPLEMAEYLAGERTLALLPFDLHFE